MREHSTWGYNWATQFLGDIHVITLLRKDCGYRRLALEWVGYKGISLNVQRHKVSSGEFFSSFRFDYENQ
jgi:hypothetical protein